MAHTAKMIKDVSAQFNGNAKLYELSAPIGYDYDWESETNRKVTNFVIVSSIDAPITGPETYIFPARKDGSVIQYIELDGSFRGSWNHKAALQGAGYKLAD